MILQSLVSYYEQLVQRGSISPPGWSDVDVSYALWLNEDGTLEKVVSLKTKDEKGKLKPQKMMVPEQMKRSSGISPNFLCDNSRYFLGIDNKDDVERSQKCFQASACRHNEILKDVNCAEATAVMRFFDKWDINAATQHPALIGYLDDITKGGNIVFCIEGKYVHCSDAIKEKWNQTRLIISDDNEEVLCSTLGKYYKISNLHPSIKGIRNAQSSGASLVSYNAPAFCSFDKEQGFNAQTGEYAAFAYGAALNYLISKLSFNQYIGDTAVLSYALNADDNYQAAFSAFMFGSEQGFYTEHELSEMLRDLCRRKIVVFNNSLLNPDMDFYVLGLAPNNARLSIRFFWHNTFGNLAQNLMAHQKRLEMNTGAENDRSIVPIWRIVLETCRKDTDPQPLLAGELFRSILQDISYPATLINAIDIRIRADHKINGIRAAIIKAYYLKNTNVYVPKEVLTVALNKDSDDVAYNLGRLFALLERIQETATPGLNATIKDKFMGSASSTPASVFPNLINLSQKHLRKIDGGLKIHLEKQVGEIMDKISTFPSILNMPERGAFQLGYFHQRQSFFSGKKED